MKKYRWTDRDTDGTYWELLKGGKVVAEIGGPTSTNDKWLWYVRYRWDGTLDVIQRCSKVM